MVIGLLLAAVALVLAMESGALLVGESADLDLIRRVRKIISSEPAVDAVRGYADEARKRVPVGAQWAWRHVRGLLEPDQGNAAGIAEACRRQAREADQGCRRGAERH